LELSYFILLVFIYKEDIDHYCWRLHMWSSASPSFSYIGHKVTSKEYDTQGINHTKIALEKLHLHLKGDKSEVNRCSNTLLGPFMEGLYSGLPVRDIEIINKETWFLFLRKIFLRLFRILIGFIVVSCIITEFVE
jgi:hypothetical protein